MTNEKPDLLAKLQREAAAEAAIFDPIKARRRPNRGWYGMACFNALSYEQQRMLIERGNLPRYEQQRMLIERGNLPMGRKVPEGGTCERGAMVAIETQYDEAPGPRFYCLACALGRLIELARSIDTDTES